MSVDITAIGLGVDTSKLTKGTKELDNFGKSANKAATQADQSTKSMGAMTSVAGRLAVVLGAAGLGAALIKTIDSYTKYNAQLKLATQTQEQFNTAIADVQRIARTAQTDISSISTLYARLNSSLREVGVTQAEVARITENVGLALKVSGAGAGESASAILQLSQAFASGVLRGEEFNAVSESAPVLMRALAQSIGVPIGQLRALAADGKITGEVLNRAFSDQKLLDSFRLQSQEIQTLGGAYQVLKNNIQTSIGQFDKATGFSKTLASGIIFLSENVGLLATAFGAVVAAAIAVNWTAIIAGASGILALLAGPVGIVALIGAASIALLKFGDDSETAYGKARKEANEYLKKQKEVNKELGAKSEQGQNTTLAQLKADRELALKAYNDQRLTVKTFDKQVRADAIASAKLTFEILDKQYTDLFSKLQASRELAGNKIAGQAAITYGVNISPNFGATVETQNVDEIHKRQEEALRRDKELQDNRNELADKAAKREEEVRKYLFNLKNELDDEATKRYNQAEKISKDLRIKNEKEVAEARAKYMAIEQDRANDNFKEAQEAYKKQAEEYNKIFDRANENLSRSLTDSIVRGFESGEKFIDNFKKAITTAFRSYFVNIGVNFAQNALSGVASKLGGAVLQSLGMGNAETAQGGGFGSVFKDLGSIFTTSNQSIIGGIESLGGSIADGMGGIRDTIGGYLGANASMLANVASYGGAILQLSQGNWAGAIGTGIGTALGGPIGGAIGSFLGGAVGGLFGGSKAKRPVYISSASSTLDSGKFSSTFGTLAGQPKQVKSLGADANLESVNKAFSESLSALLGGFGMNEKISTSIRLWKRKAALGWFNASFGEGADIALYSDLGRGDVNAAFQSFFNRVLGEGLVSAIQKTKIPEGIKQLFAGLTDTAQVTNMINAAISLNKANDALVKSFNITAEQTAKVAMVSGLAGDELVKVIAAMVDAANASRTIGDALFELRNNLKDALGGTIYSSLTEFDNALKGIDKTTQEGLKTFYELFSLRDEFAQFQTQIDNLKSGVRGSLFNVVSDAEKQAMMQEDLAKMFAKLNLEVPDSIAELIALGKSIDYTTAEGLNLASVFPSLVNAFNETQGAVESLMNTLRDSSKFASSFEFNRYTGLATNYGASFANNFVDSLPSYDVGTPYVPADGPAMIHKGEAIIPAKDNAIMQQSSIFDNEGIRAELRSIAISVMKSERSLDRLQKDGFIIRDVDANGDTQIINVTVV